MGQTNVGARVLKDVYQLLMIDAEWSKRRKRGFTWWPGQFARRVWAEPPYEDDGLFLSRIHVPTDLLRDVPDSAMVALASIMRTADLRALVWHPKDPGILWEETLQIEWTDLPNGWRVAGAAGPLRQLGGKRFDRGIALWFQHVAVDDEVRRAAPDLGERLVGPNKRNAERG
jgi:hypothetical protein